MNGITAYLRLSRSLRNKRIPNEMIKYKGMPTKEFGLYSRILIRSKLLPRFLKKKIINEILNIVENKREDFLWNEVMQNLYANAYHIKSPWLDVTLLKHENRDKGQDEMTIWDIERKSNLGFTKVYSRIRALMYLHAVFLKSKKKKIGKLVRNAELRIWNNLIGNVKYA